MRQNEACGWGTITDNVLKFRKMIEFQISWIAPLHVGNLRTQQCSSKTMNGDMSMTY